MRDIKIEFFRYTLAQTRNRTISVAAVWLIISLPLLFDNPVSVFVWAGALVFLLFDVKMYRFKKLPESAFGSVQSSDAVLRSYISVWFVYAMQWGIIAAYVFYFVEYKYLFVVVAFILAFNAIAGLLLWIYNSTAGKVFFALMYLPPLLALLFVGSLDSITASVYILISLLGIYHVMHSSADMVINAYLKSVESSRSAQKYKERSQLDALTNTYNRHYFDIKFAEELQLANSACSTLGVLLIDIDHFKSVNDNYGHKVGDQCLQKVAALMGPQIRTGDTLCRYGGEEFVVLLPGVGLEQVRDISERIRSEIEQQPLQVEGHTIAMTVSVGATVCAPGGASEELFQQADKALYQAKAQGRNRLVLYDEQGDQVLMPFPGRQAR